MATRLFRSSLAPMLEGFLETRCIGKRSRSSEKILLYLDQFLAAELKPGRPLDRKIVERYVDKMKNLSAGTRVNRIGILRQFCHYLSHFDPRTCVMHTIYVPRRNRPAPYIYSDVEIKRIMAAARKLGPHGSLRPLMVATLIGTLYSTGLRVGEALNLTLRDVDVGKRVIEVRKGKFGKSRYVPLSPSTARQIESYLGSRRKAGFSTASDSPVFLSMTGAKHGHPRFAEVFLEILRDLGLRGPRGERGPRIHDLRHTFAVSRLLAWHRQGVNLGAKMPLLSTYLGHSTVTGTEVYLQATAQLLESTGRKFYSHCAIPAQKVRYEKR
jgi:integrase/recombinase XerD